MKFKIPGKREGNTIGRGKMLSRYIRIVTVLIVILVITGVTLALANVQISTSAQVPTPTVPVKATADNCDSCHEEVHELWHKGGHGDIRGADALAQRDNCLACHKEIPVASMPDLTETNSMFSDFWENQGRPTNCLQCHVTGYDPAAGTWKTDGITCEACHSPIPSNHPDDNIPVDKNAELCSTCHTDARFGWDAWNKSAHSQNNVTCTNCHNPHSTSLKPTDQSATDTSSLCENCHKELAQNITHSQHGAESGATCIMCHLGDSKGDDDFHRVPDHDFKPKLEACNTCHADQMHGAGKSVSLAIAQDIPANDGSSVETASVVTTTPPQVSPFGYAGLAAVTGLFIGVVGNKILKGRSRRK